MFSESREAGEALKTAAVMILGRSQESLTWQDAVGSWSKLLAKTSQAEVRNEFRISAEGRAYEESVLSQKSFYYKFANDPIFSHQTGSNSQPGWYSLATGITGFLTYGPYVKGMPGGSRTASIQLLIDNATANDDVVAVVDVYRLSSNTVLSKYSVRRGDFDRATLSRTIHLRFAYDGQGELEFRVLTAGISKITHITTSVR